MDDKTTTEAPAEATGAVEAQPEQAEQAPAVDTQDAPSEEAQTNDEPSSSAGDSGYDEDTLKWFESKGIDPSAPDPAKLAKMAREAERNMHEKTSKASELEKSLSAASDKRAQQRAAQTGEDAELLARIERMEVRDAVREFKAETGFTRDQEKQMVQYLADNPTKLELVRAGYMSLKEVHQLSGISEQSPDSLRSEGSRQALETLASKQRATAPSGSAVSSQVNASSKITRAEINRRMQAGDYNWLDKHDSEINRLAAEGLLQ